MKNNFFSNYSLINVYKKEPIRSSITTQLLYGERFKVIKIKKKWLKIKLLNYKYSGYILKKNYINKFYPTHKIFVLKSRIYNKPYLTNKSKYFLPFSSRIEILEPLT